MTRLPPDASASLPGKIAAIRSLAVMQPYFYPYAGYFRLFAAADRFVVFDCVQFPRRGRVHRAEVVGPDGSVQWLTLPLAKQPRNTLICDLAFATDARPRLDAELRRLPWVRGASGEPAERIREHLNSSLDSVADFLVAGLDLACGLLGLPGPALRSSSLRIDPQLRGEDRIVEIVRRLKADQYINAPGGRNLYDLASFSDAGVELRFLPPFDGQVFQLLPALMSGDTATIRGEILGFGGLQPADG